MTRIEHEAFAMDLDDHWEVRRDVVGAELAAIAPSRETGRFATSLNVVVGEGHGSLDGFVTEHVALQQRFLTDMKVIDDEAVAFAGREGRRLLVAFVQGMYGLTSEQWMAIVGDRVVVVTGTCESDIYEEAGDAFRRSVESLELRT